MFVSIVWPLSIEKHKFERSRYHIKILYVLTSGYKYACININSRMSIGTNKLELSRYDIKV